MDRNESGRRRILFVDDEVKVLDGLRRMLYPMRKEWDMVFVASAKQALEALALDPFEVIVTDMRMPGMDGATLLDEVVKVYPEMVRLVLSGQWDQEMSIRSAKTAHQYLTKPCNAEMLKMTLDRIFALRRLLAGRSLKRLVSGMTTLPSLPTAYQRLVHTLESPQASGDQIGDVIASDVGMTAKVLQLANSAFFGSSRAFNHPAEATRYLGVDTIKALVLTIGIFSQFRGAKAANDAFEKLQHHSLHTARIAQIIAQAEGIEKVRADDAFLGGIVHDVGKLVLISKDPEMYDGALAMARLQKLDLIDPVEREVFGASHAEVGCYLLWLWGLPQTVTEAVAFHHSPANCSAPGLSAVALVHVADVLAHEFEADADFLPQPDREFLASAGLAERFPAWRALAAQTAHMERLS